MSENKGIAHERVMLLKRISTRRLSKDTDDTITQIMKNNSNNREQTASKINMIIDSSKTEGEIMEKLSKL